MVTLIFLFLPFLSEGYIEAEVMLWEQQLGWGMEVLRRQAAEEGMRGGAGREGSAGPSLPGVLVDVGDISLRPRPPPVRPSPQQLSSHCPKAHAFS